MSRAKGTVIAGAVALALMLGSPLMADPSPRRTAGEGWFDTLWSWAASWAEAGLMIDPNGKPTTDDGFSTDPDGKPTTDEGWSIDPDGVLAPATDEGPMIDPNGKSSTDDGWMIDPNG